MGTPQTQAPSSTVSSTRRHSASMGVSIAELEAAGLYDASAPDAAERLALIEWLIEQGATVEHMSRAARSGSLQGVAGDLGRARGTRLTLAEAAARARMPAERVEMIRLAIGLPRTDPGDAVFTEAEAESFAVFASGEELFGEVAIRRFSQVLGESLARMAEAAISLSTANLVGPILQGGGDELALAQARHRAAMTVPPLAAVVSELFQAHVEAAAKRLAPTDPTASMYTTPLTVGFVDLVGFTTLARQVEPGALATIIDRFEGTAHDVAGTAGGRVVKFIGDEVMFVAGDPATACDIALTLVERFATDEAVTPRGGLAAGDVLVRGGDYYGPTVNLAARMAELAVPAEILVSESVEEATPAAALRFEPAGRRNLKGFDEPVRLFTVDRPA